MNKRLSLTTMESFWYIFGCIMLLGLPYFQKIGRKKALVEVWNAEYSARLHDSVRRPEVAS